MAGFADRFVDFEITLGRGGEGRWTAEVCWTRPERDTEVRRRAGEGPAFDFADLQRRGYDPPGQGELLTRSLFGVPEVREEFIRAQAVAESENVPLRLRLHVEEEAGQLHGLAWETMRHPDRPQESLVMDGRVLFSRYLSSKSWRDVPERPNARLRAVVAVASPAGDDLQRMDEHGLAPIKVDDELSRARHGLSAFRTTELPSAGKVTSLPEFVEALREDTDIAVLICHGYFSDEEKPETVLLLQDADGSGVPVRGSRLLERLNQLRTLPSLMILVSCQSAGAPGGHGSAGLDDQRALAALGPRLAADGVPAVLAMQGNVSMVTMEQFLPAFYKELRRHGLVDQAVAVARQAVQARPDWWMPVLFTRLRSGRVWKDLDRFGKWPALLRHINTGQCVAVLGHAVADGLLPSRQEIAARWAEHHRVPMAPEDREDLAHVAQWLAVTQNPSYLGERLIGEFHKELRARAEPGAAGSPVCCGQDVARLVRHVAQLVGDVGARRRCAEPAEPHRILAELPLKFYLTTHPATFLEDALAERGRRPAVAWCHWRDEVEAWPAEDAYQQDPDYQPESERPVVFHLFGWLGDPSTLVLTEDDYLDYVIAIASKRHLVPDPVWSALASSALLLLGFRMEDWDFRGLLRIILNQEGGARRSRFTHVAVQVDPDAARTTDPEKVHEYINSYFQAAGRNVPITVYWGSVEEFLDDLQRRLRQEEPW
ncbi:MAG TPA: CHAT domain-containing protein [Candidatus Limnocylindrales bacterium]|nr:CHAT domain-containing protein [Candidatus Limnocylindrales bacterium]